MPRVSEPLIVLTTSLIKETITNSYQDAEKFTREYYQAAEQKQQTGGHRCVSQNS